MRIELGCIGRVRRGRAFCVIFAADVSVFLGGGFAFWRIVRISDDKLVFERGWQWHNTHEMSSRRSEKNHYSLSRLAASKLPSHLKSNPEPTA